MIDGGFTISNSIGFLLRAVRFHPR